MNTLPSALICLALTVPCCAGERTFALPGGGNVTVKTHMGRIVHQSNEHFEIGGIAASIDNTTFGWREPCLVWKIHVRMRPGSMGVLDCSGPARFAALNWGTRNANQNLTSYTTYSCVDETDEGWDWLREPGDRWVPFQFTYHPIDDPKDLPSDRKPFASSTRSLTFPDGALITEKEKREALKALEAYLNLGKKAVTSRTVTLAGGASLTLNLVDGQPVRFSNKHILIEALQPAIPTDPRTGARLSPCWLLKGKSRGLAAATIEVKAPWLGLASIIKARVSTEGTFTIPFGARDVAPALWEWLNSGEDAWIPVTVALTTGQPPATVEAVEWCLMRAEGIREFRDSLGQGGISSSRNLTGEQ